MAILDYDEWDRQIREAHALAAEVERVKRLEKAVTTTVEYADRNCGPCNANGIAYPHRTCDECWAGQVQALLGDVYAELDAGEGSC